MTRLTELFSKRWRPIQISAVFSGDSSFHRPFLCRGLRTRILKIPPGVARGCKIVQGPVNLFYITSHTYNPDDELRIAYDSPEIDFDWLKAPPIK